MNSLAEQLIKARIKLTGGSSTATEEVNRINRPPISKTKIVDVSDLSACTSLKEFRHAALLLLLRDYEHNIDEVIREVHRFKDGSKPGKKAVWWFYQIKEIYGRLPVKYHKQFLRRAFRKSDPTLDTKCFGR